MQTLKEFLAQAETQKIQRANPSKLLTVDFYRDPNRAVHVDPSVFLAPADGFILYSRVVSPDEDIIPIKGVNYTVNALMQEEVEAEKCLVISIFMSYLDVHINRMPTDGFLSWDKLDALKVANLSMREVEREIVSQLKVHCANIQYALYNERVKNRIFHSDINQPYYLIQIADYEVDVITHFGGKCQYYTQGERFSLIRMGSQVDLIIPFINPKIKFESLVESKILSHVEAGLDPLIRWSKNA